MSLAEAKGDYGSMGKAQPPRPTAAELTSSRDLGGFNWYLSGLMFYSVSLTCNVSRWCQDLAAGTALISLLCFLT